MSHQGNIYLVDCDHLKSSTPLQPNPENKIKTKADNFVNKKTKADFFIPSEARPKGELRSPEAELILSLGNWVGNRKKVDKKKRYDDDTVVLLFCTHFSRKI